MKIVQSTEALILRARNFKEADQILVLYSKEYGKISAIVKGVRRSKSKIRGGVQLFSHTDLGLYLGRNLATITQAQIIDSFPILKQDLEKMSYASYLSELIDAFVFEKEKDESLFNLFLTSYRLLENRDSFLSIHWSEIQILRYLGYEPSLKKCSECGLELLDFKNLYFYPALGGVTCRSCQAEVFNQEKIKISGETIMILEKLLNSEFEILEKISISKEAKKEINYILEKYIFYTLGKSLRSKKFLNSLVI